MFIGNFNRGGKGEDIVVDNGYGYMAFVLYIYDYIAETRRMNNEYMPIRCTVSAICEFRARRNENIIYECTYTRRKRRRRRRLIIDIYRSRGPTQNFNMEYNVDWLQTTIVESQLCHSDWSTWLYRQFDWTNESVCFDVSFVIFSR